MAFETISERARRLVADDEQEAAAELLADAFRAQKAQKLENLAVAQQAAIRSLAAQKMTGALSPTDFSRAKTAIDTALLQLADEPKRRFEASFLPQILKIGTVAAMLVLAFFGWKKWSEAQKMAETFDLEVVLTENSNPPKTISGGSVALGFGEKVPLEARKLDEKGQAVFRNLTQKNRGDSIRLVFAPEPSRPFLIRKQSAATATGERQTVFFEVEFLAEKTVFEGTIRDAKNRVLAGATILVDGQISTKTDAQGFFKIEIPKRNGSVSRVVVERGGRTFFNQDLTITTGFKEISVE